MAEYYAVERSPEYLMHYGVKGMRWGVRKARQLGLNTDRGARKLAQQYSKAQKRLRKLDRKANIEEQRNQQIKYAKRAGVGFGISGLGMLGIGGSKLIKNAIKKDEASRAILSPNWSGSDASYDLQLAKHNDEFKKRYANVNTAKKISAAVDLAGIGYAGYAGARSLMAKHRQTAKGHANAVAKRDAWKREMDKNFSGTRFGKNGSATKLTRQLQRSAKEYLKNEGYKTAGKSNSQVHTMVPNMHKKKRK